MSKTPRLTMKVFHAALDYVVHNCVYPYDAPETEESIAEARAWIKRKLRDYNRGDDHANSENC
jgi:hypothetical protein